MTRLISGIIKKTPSANADPNRYTWLNLQNAEPDLGVPASDGSLFVSSTTGTRSWTDTITIVGEVATINTLTVTGNSNLGSNSNVKITGGGPGQFIVTDGSGNLAWSSAAISVASGISNDQSSVAIVAPNGNISMAVAGTLNVVVVSDAGAIVTGNVGVSGNITAANFTTNTGIFTGNGSGLSSIAGANVIGTVPSATTATTAGAVTNNAQSNITSVGTLTSLDVTGNLTAANITSNTGVFTGNGSGLSDLAGANVTGTVPSATTATTAGTVTTNAQPNITSVGTLTGLDIIGNANINGTTIDTSGNITAPFVFANVFGNISGNLAVSGSNGEVIFNNEGNTGTSNAFSFDRASNVLFVNGNIDANFFNGNGSALSSITGANVTGEVSFAATANSVAGANISGTVANATFATSAGSATTAGTVTTAAQPNITSVGTLTGLAVDGNITAANITANTGIFTGNGSGLTALTGANVSGTVANATFATSAGSATTASTVTTNAQPNITSLGTLSNLNVSGNTIISGNLTVDGNLVYVNVEALSVEDPIIQLQTGPNGAAPIANSGKDVGTALNYYDTQARTAFMGWDVSNVEFGLASQASIASEVVTFTSYGNLRVGNIIGNGQALTGLAGANVTGTVANATSAVSAITAGTVTTSAQPNITSVGTLTSLGVTGNITSGNANLGNLVTANYFAGDGSQLVNIPIGTTLANGTSNINISTANGNITTSVDGTANVLVVTATGANITGTLNTGAGVITGNGSGLSSIAGANVTGAVAFATTANAVAGANVSGTVSSATSATTAGTVTSAAQPNITSIGTLTSLDVTSNITSGNANLGNLVTANYFAGDGSQLVNIPIGTTLANGTSNINISTANGNISVSIGGTANVLVVTAAGVSVAGALNTGTNNANVGNLGAAQVLATANVIAPQLISNIATGTAPLVVTSTTQVANLNAATAGTVTTAAQGNITSVGILTSLGVTGNITSGNANLGNLVTANYFAGDGSQLVNIPIGTSLANGLSSVAIPEANGNVNTSVNGVTRITATAIGANITGILDVSSNILSGNANLGNLAIANFFSGDGSQLTNIPIGTTLANGTSSVNIPTAAGNVNTIINGTTRIVATTTGANITGTLGVSGNANVGNLGTGNITSDNANLGNLATANFFSGDGSQLTNIPIGTSLANGTSSVNIPTAAGNVNTSVGGTANVFVVTSTGANVTGNLNASGNISSGNANLGNLATANYFAGDGSQLTNIPIGTTLANGTSSVSIPTAAGNVNTSVGGTANVFVVTATGTNVTGTLNASSNITTSANLVTDLIVGRTSGISITATGTNQNITLAPTGTGFVDVNSKILGNLATPAAATDAATKQYVDEVAQGLIVKAACKAATTGTLAVASGGTITYNNGTAGVGATLTVAGGTFTTIDDVPLLNGDRVLVKNEVVSENNGIYLRTNATVLTRAPDFDNSPSGEVSGAFTFISGGTVNADDGFVCTTDNPVVMGTTAINFSQFSGAGTYTPGTGLTLTGSVFSITDTTVTAGAYGNGDYNATFTVNAQGQLTAAANVAIAANAANLTGSTLASGITTSSLTTVGTLTALGVTGNITSGNANLGNAARATYFIGDGSLLTNIPIGTSLSNGTSSVSIPTASGNVNTVVSGTTRIIATSAGANVTGTLDVSGNANVANLVVGSGTGGNISGANVISANFFIGDGSQLTGITVAAGSSIVNGTSNVVVDASGNVRTSVASAANVFVVTATGANIAGTLAATGNINIGSSYFLGDGSQLTNLPITQFLANGTSNVAVNNNGPVTISVDGTSNVVIFNKTIANITGRLGVTGNANVGNIGATNGVFTNVSGNGAALTAINADNITTGTIDTARIPTLNQDTTGSAATVTTASQPNITSTGTLVNLAVSGTAATTLTDSTATSSSLQILQVKNGTQVLGIGAAMGPGSFNGLVGSNDIVIVGSNTAAQGTANITITPWSTGSGGIRIVTVSNVTSSINLNATTTALSGALQTANITTGASSTAGAITGNWTLTSGSRMQATYADLAERYVADELYEPGTVVVLGGTDEVTIENIADSHKVAGVVTTNPAYIMNAELQGDTVVEVALIGRVPCKVIGPISKGDLLTTSEVAGYAHTNNNALAGRIIGKALENFEGEAGFIEILIGRT